MNINSPAHDLHTFSLFSPNLNSLTLKVVGQWSHFSPILPPKRSFVINTVVQKKKDTPLLCGAWLYPMVVLGWLGGLRNASLGSLRSEDKVTVGHEFHLLYFMHKK